MNREHLKALFEKTNYPIIKATFLNGNKERLRLFKTRNDEIAYFIKGSHRKGVIITDLYLNNIGYFEEEEINKPEKWLKGMLKIKTLLKNSGLWSEVLKDTETALSIGYEKLKECQAIENKYFYKSDYNKDQEQRLTEIKKICPELIKQDKETGKDYINVNLLWHFADIPKIKKMNFGKYQNEQKLQEIKTAIANNQKIHISGRTNYDVSFEFNPEIKQAWYSEEFKDCGNGHYYLALNETHALFYEDD